MTEKLLTGTLSLNTTNNWMLWISVLFFTTKYVHWQATVLPLLKMLKDWLDSLTHAPSHPPTLTHTHSPTPMPDVSYSSYKYYLGERDGSVVECRTPEREVGGSKPTAAVLCPWARNFTPRKYWLITQEAMAPSRHDWKIVDWDVKPQHTIQILPVLAVILCHFLFVSPEKHGVLHELKIRHI